MRLPAALVPLRHLTFRRLWIASVIGWLGTWLQNTGAGWLMTTLQPEPLIVAMVQAATIMPVFLLALPGGALADIVDRRVFLIGTQTWTICAASLAGDPDDPAPYDGLVAAGADLRHRHRIGADPAGVERHRPPSWSRARTWCRPSR